ncbi:MAG: tRNA adenosine(34) deaminase TadA [Bacillota bacterium]|nr:tRNA adenosine(34) deaminase TadA [Bacillota bacterium]
MALNDEQYMEIALQLAEEAYTRGEVPIGALLVRDGEILAQDHNRREELKDATAHAEILVLRKAGQSLGGWRLLGTALYVTLEPCPMCAGALVQARVSRLVYGARDPKAGAAASLYNITSDPRLNHRLEVNEGILSERCAALLQDFFKERRDRGGIRNTGTL